MPAGRDDSAPNERLPLTSNGELIKRGISLSAFCPPGDQIAKFPPAIQESEYKSNLRVRHNYKLRLQYITTSPYQYPDLCIHNEAVICMIGSGFRG